MDKFSIVGSKLTPAIDFDAVSGLFTITGRSLPEHAQELYTPVLEWMDAYFAAGIKSPTTLTIFLEYINSSSNKYLLQILRKMEEWFLAGHQVSVNWYHHEVDEDAMEIGEEYKELLKLPIHILVKE